MGTKLIIDTDIGTDIDDALAIVFALASPELELEGLTIVDGDVEARAKMASRLLGMAGRPDIPVVRGDGQPIAAGRMPTWMGHEGKGILDLDWQGAEAPILDGHAADWLVERSRAAPFRLAAIGPFTNVARAVERDPGFAGRIEGLTVMGGMAHAETYIEGWQHFFAETGIDPAHMDHNTASDLDAALRMAQAGFKGICMNEPAVSSRISLVCSSRVYFVFSQVSGVTVMASSSPGHCTLMTSSSNAANVPILPLK